MRSDVDYLRNNERRINRILFRCVIVLFLVGPVLALFHWSVISPITYVECVALSLFDLLVVVSARYFINHQRYEYLTKYILILGMHLGVCFLATKEGTNLHIAYAMMPALSCLYFQKRFTLQTMGMSYVMMILSLYVRAFMEVSTRYPDWSQLDWFGVNGIAFTWEYILLAAILYALVETIADSLLQLRKKHAQVYEMQKQLVIGFANVLESRDRGTGHHVRRTGEYVNMLAKKLLEQGHYSEVLTEKFIDDLTMAAPLHDAGKICVPDSILLKQDRLTEEEYEVMKGHTTEGHRLVEENLWNLADKELYQRIEEMVLCHHERWNGGGYPRGIAGADIPLGARIMAVADALDAMLSKRCYKSRMKIDEALEHLREQSGIRYEPCIVEAAIAMKEDIIAYMNGEEVAEKK